MAHHYYNLPKPGYWPPPDFPELPSLQDPDPHGIWEARDQARHEEPPVPPPCKVLKVAFQRLRILEADILYGAWAGPWEQHLMVAQINGIPDRTVPVDLAGYRTGLGPVQVPIEIPLSYTEYVRVVRPNLVATIRARLLGLSPYIPFTVATGGTAEFGLLGIGKTELPHSEKRHGDSHWMVGENTLAGSDNGMTYEVIYKVSCCPVFRFGIPYEKVIAGFMQASPVEGQAGAQVDFRSVNRILRRLGYAVVADHGGVAERLLEIEGPGDFDTMLKALRPDRILG